MFATALARTFALIALLVPTAIFAQPTPRVTAGVAGAWVDDAAPRLVLGALEEGESGWAWLIDANVFVTPRVAIGFELLRPQNVATETRGHFGEITAEEEQATLSGTVRVVAARGRVASFEVVGGIGQLRSTTRRQTVDIWSPSRPVLFDRTEQLNLLVWSAGADLLLTPARHLALGPMGRFYWLRAPEQERDVPGEEPGLLGGPSTRVVVGAVVRAVW